MRSLETTVKSRVYGLRHVRAVSHRTRRCVRPLPSRKGCSVVKLRHQRRTARSANCFARQTAQIIRGAQLRSRCRRARREWRGRSRTVAPLAFSKAARSQPCRPTGQHVHRAYGQPIRTRLETGIGGIALRCSASKRRGWAVAHFDFKETLPDEARFHGLLVA